MPHTRSAKKNLRKTQKLRLHNRAVKKAVKTQIKRFQAALEGPAEELRTQFNLACKKLDKAAAKNIVHANLAGARNRNWPAPFTPRKPPPNRRPPDWRVEERKRSRASRHVSFHPFRYSVWRYRAASGESASPALSSQAIVLPDRTATLPSSTVSASGPL